MSHSHAIAKEWHAVVNRYRKEHPDFKPSDAVAAALSVAAATAVICKLPEASVEDTALAFGKSAASAFLVGMRVSNTIDKLRGREPGA